MAISIQMKLCECGCGRKVKPGKCFVNGHWIRLHNPMENPLSVAKISGSNSSSKRPEVRQKMSESHSRLWLEHPELNPMKNPIVAKKVGKTKASLWREHPELNPMHSPDSRAKLVGDKNPNWQGGLSNLPYPFEFNSELKEIIHSQWNHQCQLCGISQMDHAGKLGIHHIDYNKENLASINLIPLCPSCNAKVNFNRVYWRTFFQAKTSRIRSGR